MIESIENIVIGLKQDTNIFASLANRIYIGQPIEEPSDLYLTINQISQTQNIITNNRSRVEFRYIGDNLGELGDIETLITQYLFENHQSLGFYNMEIGSSAHGYDDKKKPVLIRDYIFYKVTTL